MSPYQLFGLARSEGYSGSLAFSRNRVRKQIYFEQGVPVSSASNVMDETLGSILLERKVINAKQYADSVHRLRSGAGKQGEILLASGALDEKVLNQALHHQHRHRTVELFRWNEGMFQREDAAPTFVYPLCFWDVLRRGVLTHFGRKVLAESARRHGDHIPTLRDHPWAESYARIPEVPALLRRLAGKATVREFCANGSDGFMDLCILRAWGLISMQAGSAKSRRPSRPVLRPVRKTPQEFDRAMSMGKGYLQERRYTLAAYYFGMVEEERGCAAAAAFKAWCQYRVEPHGPDAVPTLMKALEKGLAVGPEEADLWAFRGALHKMMGNGAPAAADFRQALTLVPKHPLALRERKTLEMRHSTRRPPVDRDAVDWNASIVLQTWIGAHAVIRNFKEPSIRIGSGEKDDLLLSAQAIPGLVAAHCTLTTEGQEIHIHCNRTDGFIWVNGRALSVGESLRVASSDIVVLGGNQKHGGLNIRIIDLDVVEQATLSRPQ